LRIPVPLGAQVLVGVGVLLMLFVASILVAVLLILQLSGDERLLSTRRVPYSTSVDEAALAAKGAANDARGFLISGEGLYVAEFNRRVAEARSSFATASRAGAGDSETRPAEAARALFERWVAATRREFRELEAGNRAGAIAASTGPDRRLRKRYEADLARAQAVAAAEIHASASAFSGASRRSVTILLSFLLATLVLGVVIATWVVRTILKPVYSLLRMFGDGIA
jgi:methyl-accepting chemotaxis protein